MTTEEVLSEVTRRVSRLARAQADAIRPSQGVLRLWREQAARVRENTKIQIETFRMR